MRILIDASSAILLYKAGVLDGVLDAYDVWMSRAASSHPHPETNPPQHRRNQDQDLEQPIRRHDANGC